MNDNLFRTILKRYEAEIEDANYKIEAICEHNIVIPEHVDITGEVDKQLERIAMYAMAHDYVYGSRIEQGVIMVCTPDLYYQEFKTEGADLRAWKHKALKRINMYNEMRFDEKEKAKVELRATDFTGNESDTK